MFLIIFAALIAAGETAKLDRTYLPPVSAATAGGSPGSLQLPFSRSNEGSQGRQDIPTGGFVNDHQGIVVEAALAGTRASGPQSGLGGPRNTYGSSDSKVGDAAFRVQTNQFPQGPTGSNEEPDLSAFHRPPSRKPGNIQIIRDYVSNTINYQNNIGLDKFNYAFETDNGIKMAEKGISRNGVQAQGGFSYTGDDGKVYSVVYTADKNGFRPTGNHLPTPPPIPAEILESLKQNARDEAAGLIDDGSYDAKKYNTEDDYAENDANDKYNDRQSNKFGDRPAFVGGFINQNQQAFVAPNFNGQFGFNDASKDSTFSKPDSSKFGSFRPQTGNRFGSIREPSKDVNNLFNNKQQQVENQFPGFTNNAANFNVQGKPLSQQKLQDQKPFPERPSFNRPSSYDTSNLGILASNVGASQPNVNSFSISNQPISNSFGNGNNKPSGQAFQNKPAQGSFGFNTLNQGVSNDQNLNNNKQFSPQSSLSSTLTSSQPSSGYFTSQPTQQFPSSKVQSSQNSRLPGSQFSSSPVSANSNGASEISNQAVSTTPLRPITPTKQPQTTLTTPLESFGTISADESLSQTDNNNKDRLATDLYNLDNRFSGIQTTQSIENNNSQTGQVSTSFNKPTNAQFSQPQAPDHSYIYNRPNKPFNTPISRPGFISTSGPTSQETASLLSQSSIFTNAPEASLQNKDVTGINTYPQSPDSSSIKGKENDYQSSRVTQASFPSIASGVSSNLNAKPSQQLSVNMPSPSAFSQISPTLTTATAQASSIPNSETLSTQGIEDLQSQDVNTNIPSQQNTEEVYQYPKPTEGLPSKESAQSDKGNTASKDSSSPQFNTFGTRRPINQQSSFGLQPQFGQGSFNNKGSVVPTFPTNTQQNKPQSPQFGQNIATSSKQPNQSFSFRPQSQQQFNVNTASRFGSKPFTSVPSFSQSTSSGFTNPNTFSQTGQHSSYKPTEQPATQSNFDSKGTTFSQIQGSRQPSFPPFNKPSFGFNTQNPVVQFGQQSLSSSKRPATEPIEQIGKEPISPVSSQSPSIVSKFGDKPSSVGGQFGQIGGQSSQTPFGQTSSFGVQNTTKFNQGSFGSEESTMPEESGDSFDSKLSTLLPSTVQSQTSSFDTQRPVSQFGQSSFSISSIKPSSQSQFGSQQGITSFGQGSFNNKETTTSQFDQSTQQFGSQFENKPSTPNPSSSQTQFDNRKTTNNQFNVPTTNFDQFISTNQPSQPSEQMTTQFGYDNDSKTTTNAKFDIKQQATNSNEPSTLISSTSETQTPTQNSDFGQIYDYTKPSQGLVTPSQQQDKQPFQSNTQFGQQSFLNVQKEKPAQFTQPSFNFATSQFTATNDDKTESVTQKNALTGFPSTQSFSPTSQNFDQNTGTIYEYNRPDNRFGQQDSSIVQKEKPAQFTKPSFNFPSSQFSTNEDKTESVTQQNTLAGFPSTQDAFSSTSQNSDQNTGTIYEYNKPDNRFGQQGSLSVQKEKPAQFTKPSFNFASSQFSTNEDKTESVTQQNTLAGFPSTQEDFSSTSQNSDQSTGTIFEYNKPDNRFGQQGSLSVQKEKPTQFTKPLFNFPNSQFSTNEDKTESVTQQNTLAGFPSTQNAFSSTSQNSDQSTGSVFEYNTPNNRFGQQEPSNVQKEKPTQFTKPLFNFANSQFSTNEDKTESVTQQNTLAGFPSTQDAFSSTSQNSGQNTGSVFEYNTPNNRFGQQELSTAQKEKPAQFTQPSFNFGNSQFSTNEDKTESVTQQNTLTGFPSTQDAFSTSQNSDKSSGEIYEYNKPEQSLSTSSDTDRTTQFGQKPQNTSDGNEDSFSTNQQTTPQFGQTTFNFQNTQKTDDLTSTTSLETEKRPQLAFHSACCGGSIFKRPLSANSNPSLNIFNQKESSGQKEGQNDQKDKEPEKASSFAGIGEKFPSSRQPPSFDENGYHY